MWNRPAPNALDPRRTALVVFDMLEIYRPEIEAAGAVPKARRLIRLCRDNAILRSAFHGTALESDLRL